MKSNGYLIVQKLQFIIVDARDLAIPYVSILLALTEHFSREGLAAPPSHNGLPVVYFSSHTLKQHYDGDL